MTKYYIDANGPGIVYAIREELHAEFFEYMLYDGRSLYDIPKERAIRFVFEGTDNGWNDEKEYWRLDHCEWFESFKKREEDQQLDIELDELDEFRQCEEEPYDRVEEPPIRKSKKARGGKWVPLVNRRAA